MRPLALAAAGLAALVLALGVFGDKGLTSIQGDAVGPETRETKTQYVERAEDALAMTAAPGYAMVAFKYPLRPDQAARAVDGVQRVGAMFAPDTGLVPLPEPVAGTGRADVLSTALGTNAGGLSAVVIFDTPEAMRAIAQRGEVLAVEPAPADSAWGAFAVRPPNF
ncbi:hypothetical protein CPHO_04385 [Corynebacterium phocae]|uniref:Uncharacterized protein n=1 Tax=Corynebacterium phocae TaxID=161895 RepID=A0A1L7D283_9CORY|nr:hypothetical protein [Corynebacterium phocae]APT92255.1 hypothetical protein CPHO_04385 [Corynebacterium phocae]KAA8725398.1 hypothetical protein F4V58_03935 [Corynebacterium phocae]